MKRCCLVDIDIVLSHLLSISDSFERYDNSSVYSYDDLSFDVNLILGLIRKELVFDDKK